MIFLKRFKRFANNQVQLNGKNFGMQVEIRAYSNTRTIILRYAGYTQCKYQMINDCNADLLHKKITIKTLTYIYIIDIVDNWVNNSYYYSIIKILEHKNLSKTTIRIDKRDIHDFNKLVAEFPFMY